MRVLRNQKTESRRQDTRQKVKGKRKKEKGERQEADGRDQISEIRHNLSLFETHGGANENTNCRLVDNPTVGISRFLATGARRGSSSAFRQSGNCQTSGYKYPATGANQREGRSNAARCGGDSACTGIFGGVRIRQSGADGRRDTSPQGTNSIAGGNAPPETSPKKNASTL